jgi:hypothetical protein
MAIYAALHTLGATAIEVVPPSTQPQEVTMHNQNKSSNQYIHIGNANVSTTNSMHMDPAQTIKVTLMPSQSLYAISDPVGLQLGVLAIRKD